MLVPFCRLVTTRSSWTFDTKSTKTTSGSERDFVGLQVDLDMTNTGHAVGEVETIASSEDDIRSAKEKVQGLIDQIKETSKGNDDGPAVGKLEHYLMTYRPEHYNACISSGVIADNRKS